MGQTAEQRWACYWKDPERIREYNRLQYWKKKGVDPPEWKRYKLRQVDAREEIRQQVYEKLNALKKELEEKEAALAERETRFARQSADAEAALAARETALKEQIKEVKKAPKPRPEPRPKKTPPAPVITAPVSFVVGKDAFA